MPASNVTDIKAAVAPSSTDPRIDAKALYAKAEKSFNEKNYQQVEQQSFINRFKAKASKARQAQSRMKALDRMEVISAVQAESPFHFSFKEASKCPNPLLTVDHATVAYGDHIVLTHLNLSIAPTDRIALLGPNGAGKSSLIKLLAAELDPAKGERVAGPGLKIGYFAQHQVDHLDLSGTPLQNLQKLAPNSREQELRGFLGGFGFSGDRISQPIKDFSGGEKSRLALALIVWQRPNILLLDEPTNHLDLEMRNALSLALQEYEGAMILVSHDRFLLRSTADRLILVANGKAQNFEGDVTDYEKWLFEFRKQENASAKKDNNKKPVIVQTDEQRKKTLARIKKIETEISKLEVELAKVELLLADVTIYEPINKDKLQKGLEKQKEITKQLKLLEEEWLGLQE